MSKYRIQPVEFGALRTVPLASRGGKVRVAPRAWVTFEFAHLLKPVAHGARRLADGVRGPGPETLGEFWADFAGAASHSKRNSLRSLGLQTQAP